MKIETTMSKPVPAVRTYRLTLNRAEMETITYLLGMGLPEAVRGEVESRGGTYVSTYDLYKPMLASLNVSKKST